MIVRFRALTASRSPPLHKSPTPKDGSKQASTTCYSQTAIHPLAKTSPMCDHQRMGEHLCQYGARLYGTVSSASARQLSSPWAVSTRSFSQAEKEVPRQVCLFGRKPLSVAGMATTVLRGKQVWVRDPALADEDVFYKGKVISEDDKNVRNTRPAGGPTSCFCPFPRICDLPCLQPGRQNLDPVLCVSGTGHRRITVGQLQHSSLAQGAHSRGASSFSNAFSVATMLPCARKARVRAASDADAALAAARAAAATAASEGSAAAAAAATAVWQQL